MTLPHKILTLICILFVFASCETDLVITSDVSNELVVNSILHYDEPFLVNLSKTRNILSPDDKIREVKDARVFIFDEDYKEVDELLYVDSVGYISFKYPRAGKTYHLEIQHKDYKTVTATTQVPNLVTAEVNAELREDNNGVSESIFNLEIVDDLGGNYYIWELIYQPSDEVKTISASIVSQDDNTDNIIPDPEIAQQRIFLKNKSLNSKTIQSVFVSEELFQAYIETAKVRLFTVSEDAYNFYKSIELYKNSAANYIDPVEIHSNVKNGIGIFGAEEVIILDINL